jgi:hypothetical protein
MVIRLINYALFLIGAVGVFVQYHYTRLYAINPAEKEYMVGVAMAIVYFGAFWVIAPVFALFFRKKIKKAEIVLSAMPLLIAIALFLFTQTIVPNPGIHRTEIQQWFSKNVYLAHGLNAAGDA